MDHETTTAVVKAEPMVPASIPVDAMRHQINDIQQLMKSVMREGEHYGVIPGTGSKPTLLKAGAEKLCFAFRLATTYEIHQTDSPNGHREYRVTCHMSSIESGKMLGSGVGLCATMESRYRWRKAERTCPKCGATAIIQGKAEYGGGWICFAKKGGCGAKFAADCADITGQPVGRAENPDVADCYNTVLKMAKKRAHVDACLTVLGASDIFAQDIEDMAPVEDVVEAVFTEAPKTDPEKDRLLKDLGNELARRFGSDQTKKRDALQELFGTRKWADVQNMPISRIQSSLDELIAPPAEVMPANII